MGGGQPHRATSAPTDLLDSGVAGYVGTIKGAKLTGGSTAATAQLVDADGTILADLACAIGGSDVVHVPILFRRKVTVQTLTGTGASVMVWI